MHLWNFHIYINQRIILFGNPLWEKTSPALFCLFRNPLCDSRQPFWITKLNICSWQHLPFFRSADKYCYTLGGAHTVPFQPTLCGLWWPPWRDKPLFSWCQVAWQGQILFGIANFGKILTLKGPKILCHRLQKLMWPVTKGPTLHFRKPCDLWPMSWSKWYSITCCTISKICSVYLRPRRNCAMGMVKGHCKTNFLIETISLFAVTDKQYRLCACCMHIIKNLE